MVCPFCKSVLRQGATVCTGCGAERSVDPGLLAKFLYCLIPIIGVASIFVTFSVNDTALQFLLFFGTNALSLPLVYIIKKRCHDGPGASYVWLRSSHKA
jgi:energy-converting hydrogenase Eha subunit E